MTILLLYLFLFIVGCFFGWILEVLFRRFFSAKKWVNPGFMKGPWLPLYGFGVITMFTMTYLVVSFFPSSMHFYNPLGGLFERDYICGPIVNDLIPIILMWTSMVLLEFIAGLMFIKGFHIKLWDYSNMKGNVMGIICPLFNILWLLVAIIFYYGINPFLYLGATNVYNYMFGENGMGAHFGFIFALGIIYGLLIWDFISSIGLFAKISKFSKEKGILDKYENIKAKWEVVNNEAKNKMFGERKKKDNLKVDKIKEKIAGTIYVDPEKEKHKEDNYDKDGRPIKMDE